MTFFINLTNNNCSNFTVNTPSVHHFLKSLNIFSYTIIYNKTVARNDLYDEIEAQIKILAKKLTPRELGAEMPQKKIWFLVGRHDCMHKMLAIWETGRIAYILC